ncbi:MAG: hypothetical protein V1835_04825 [Candidatus Micrarchaeota archaeon]
MPNPYEHEYVRGKPIIDALAEAHSILISESIFASKEKGTQNKKLVIALRGAMRAAVFAGFINLESEGRKGKGFGRESEFVNDRHIDLYCDVPWAPIQFLLYRKKHPKLNELAGTKFLVKTNPKTGHVYTTIDTEINLAASQKADYFLKHYETFTEGKAQSISGFLRKQLVLAYNSGTELRSKYPHVAFALLKNNR